MSHTELFFTVVAWVIFVLSGFIALLVNGARREAGTGDVYDEMRFLVVLGSCITAFLSGAWLYIVYFFT